MLCAFNYPVLWETEYSIGFCCDPSRLHLSMSKSPQTWSLLKVSVFCNQLSELLQPKMSLLHKINGIPYRVIDDAAY